MSSPARNHRDSRFSTALDLTDEQRAFVRDLRAGWLRWAHRSQLRIVDVLPGEEDVHVFRTRQELRTAMERRGFPVDGTEVAAALGPPYGIAIAGDLEPAQILGQIADGVAHEVGRRGAPYAGSDFGNSAFAALQSANILLRYCDPTVAAGVRPAHARAGIIADELLREVAQKFVATPARTLDEITRSKTLGPGHESWSTPVLRAALGGGSRWQIFVDARAGRETYKRMLQLAEELELPGAIRRLQSLHRRTEPPHPALVARVARTAQRPAAAKLLTVQEQRLLDATVRPESPREWALPPDERPGLLKGIRDIAADGVIKVLGGLERAGRGNGDTKADRDDASQRPTPPPPPRPPGLIAEPPKPWSPVRPRRRLNERSDTSGAPETSNERLRRRVAGNERSNVDEPPVSAAWPDQYVRPIDPIDTSPSDDPRGGGRAGREPPDAQDRPESETTSRPEDQKAPFRPRTPRSTPKQRRRARRAGDDPAAEPEEREQRPVKPPRAFKPPKPAGEEAQPRDAGERRRPPAGGGQGEQSSRPKQSVLQDLMARLQEIENELSTMRKLVLAARANFQAADEDLRKGEGLVPQALVELDQEQREAELQGDVQRLDLLADERVRVQALLDDGPQTRRQLGKAVDGAERAWAALAGCSSALLNYSSMTGIPIFSDAVRGGPYAPGQPSGTAYEQDGNRERSLPDQQPGAGDGRPAPGAAPDPSPASPDGGQGL
jgi:hypothetical protein